MAEQDNETKREISTLRNTFDQLNELRITHESQWMELAKWFAPRRNFTLEREPGVLRQRRIVDMTAVTAGQRLAALLHGYMMNPYQPWIAPMLLGREPLRAEEEWFEDTQQRQHRFLTGAQSTFRTSSYETIFDGVIFGNGVQIAGKARVGGKPFYRAIPLIENYWKENDEGVIDVNYRKYKQSLHDAAMLYPDAPGIQKKKSESQGDNALRDRLTFIHACEPRNGGMVGAANIRKPFASIIYCEDTNEIVSRSGYDEFPYQIFRIARQAGDTYGTGMGWEAYPLHRLLNAMMADLALAAEMNNLPPLLDMTGRLKSLDRRPGAVNSITAAEAMLMSDGELIKRLHEPGDASLGVELIAETRAQIEKIMYVDWLSLRDGPQMTATEVKERRDIRLRSMTPIVARGEQEFLNAVADRTFNLMQRGNLLEPPPASLDGEEIGWNYTSPLAMAQRQSELETIGQTFALMEQAAAFDPKALHVIRVPEMLRAGVDASGLPIRFTRPEKEVRALIEQDAERERDARQLEGAQAMAGAARDGGQALASIKGVA